MFRTPATTSRSPLWCSGFGLESSFGYSPSQSSEKESRMTFDQIKVASAFRKMQKDPFGYLSKVAQAPGDRLVQSKILNAQGNPYVLDSLTGKLPKAPGSMARAVSRVAPNAASKARYYGAAAKRGLPIAAAAGSLGLGLWGAMGGAPKAPPPSGLMGALSRNRGLALAGGAAGLAGLLWSRRNRNKREQQYYG